MERARPANQHLTSPFMELPLELRRHIYSYLIPNVRVTTESRDQASNYELRIDGDRCYPTFLETNRQIYHEMADQWYSSTWYDLLLSKNTLRFANMSRLSTLDLPSGFRYITKLSLTIRLEFHRCEDDYTGLGPLPWNAKQYLSMRNEVAKYFSPSGRGNNLHVLEIDVTGAPLYFRLMADDKYWKDSIRKGLGFHLHPLRKMRAPKVRVRFCVDLEMGPHYYSGWPQVCPTRLKAQFPHHNSLAHLTH
jgi:hypothetical protein